MNVCDPEVRAFIRQAMVARIATLSRSGRPSITPLYFVYISGHIWLGTVEWTLAAREAKADPRVTILFQIERKPNDGRILRVTGHAQVRTEIKTMRSSKLWMAFRYILTPGGIRNYLTNHRLLKAELRYHAQSAEKGRACVIDVTPERAEFLTDIQPR